MLLLDQIAEARITEALERGELDGLPGAGRPLRLDDDSFVPTELRMAHRVLRNAGYLPPEVELRREIHTLENTLGAEQDPDARRRGLKRLACLTARLEAGRTRQTSLLLEEAYYERVVSRLAGEPCSRR